MNEDGCPHQVYRGYKQNTQDREAQVVRTAGDSPALAHSIAAADPFSFAAATVVVLNVAGLACGVPARRAGAVDPAVTLRVE